MSCILYYSKFCKSSNKVLQLLSKFDMTDQIHFVCIDGRIKKNGKTYAVLGNGQEMLIPENINAVPALLILNQQYKVIYGNEIIDFFQGHIEKQINTATKNNTIPINAQTDQLFTAFGGFGGTVASDHYSFLDQSDAELNTKGNGGLRQMHNYATADDSAYTISHNFQKNQTQQSSQEFGSNRIKDGEYTLDQLKQQREQEFQMYAPPRKF